MKSKKSKKQPLSQRQIQFAKEYVVDLNGSQAAIRAGYSVKGADLQARRLLGDDRVSDIIRKVRETISERLEITSDKVLQEIAALAFSNIHDFVDENNNIKKLHDLPRLTTKAVAGIETTETIRPIGGGEFSREIVTKLKFHSKVSSLDQIARHLGMFEKDNKQKGGIKIKVTNKKSSD